MATNLATLGIKVDPSQAISGANKARKAILRIGKAAKKIGGAIGGIGKSFAKFGAIGAGVLLTIGYFVKKSLDATDAMAKMSRAIGVSVESLQKLRHAGNLAGMGSTAVDKAVQKLAVNMADVAKGTGEAIDIFKKYGIKATDLHGDLRPVEDVMLDVADATAGITNRTEKAELAYRLFGARGGLMINMLEQGSEAMREQWQEAEALGLVMSEKTARGVEEANDAMARLSGFLTSSFRRAIAELAPAITEITNGIRAWVEMKVKEEGGIGAVAKMMATKVLIAVGVIIDAVEMMANVFISTMKKIHDLNPFASSVADLEEEIQSLFDRLDDIRASEGFADGMKMSTDAAFRTLEQIKDLNAELALTRKMEDLEPISFASTREHLIKIIEDINKVNETPITPTIILGGDDEELTIFDKLKDGLVNFKTEFETVWNDMDTKNEDIFTRMGEKAAEIFGPGGTFSQSIGDATAKMLVYGEKSDLTMKKIGQSILSNVVSSLVTEGVQMAVNWVKKKAMAMWEVATAASVEASTTAIHATGTAAKTTTSVTAAATETAAWTPAAMMTSLASFGTNALLAIAGIMAVSAIMKSFDGGGFTGTGTRSGGVDGKGGFMAVMHPNETVIDHTKGQKAGGVVENTIVNNTDVNFTIVANDTAGFDNLLSERRGLIMGMINEAMNDRGQRGLA